MWKFRHHSATAVGGFARGLGDATWSAMNTMLVWNIMGMVNQQLPSGLHRLWRRLKSWWYQEMQITIPEQGAGWYTHNKMFNVVETYLGTMASDRALCLRAGGDRTGRHVVLSMDDSEAIADTFFPSSSSGEGKKARGIRVRWAYYCKPVEKARNGSDTKRCYRLTFDARHRTEVVKEYLEHVMETSREIEQRNRQRKLYTNSMGGDRLWTQVLFKHPATFQTLAMDPEKKQEIMDDLETFSKSQDYYAKIGKAWKRGYLLYGPPGTGKSTMIASMANFLDYDVYDLELTAVKDNTELRRLIVNTTGKSIIVIEDIDCCLHLSGKRAKGGQNSSGEEKKGKVKAKDKEEEGESKVTLSGLLNFIDGLWSAYGAERIVVFTTNHVDKLDPALIRKGRMDMHIEMGHCGFEAFKVLAGNYLDVEEHPLFERVRELLEEVEVTPADVAEQLMPKNIRAEDRAGRCLGDLVQQLEKVRDGRRKVKVTKGPEV